MSIDIIHDPGRAIQQPSWSAEEPAGEKRRDSGFPRLGVEDCRPPPALGKEDAIDSRLCGARPSWEAEARPPPSPLPHSRELAGRQWSDRPSHNRSAGPAVEDGAGTWAKAHSSPSRASA